MITPMDGSCYSCQEAAATDLTPRARVLRTSHWRVVHAFDCAIPGWLVALPVRHVISLAELARHEAAELGPLLVDLSTVLTAELGCLKTYVMQFAEAQGWAHAHFHVVPRMADLPERLRGPRVFGALGNLPDGERVPEAEMDRLSTALAARLTELRGT